MTDVIATILRNIVAERERQNLLKAEGRFKYTCADAELDDFQRFTILSEEVGEVARAILEQQDLSVDKNGASLRTELVQVCAVCVAWLESEERKFYGQ